MNNNFYFRKSEIYKKFDGVKIKLKILQNENVGKGKFNLKKRVELEKQCMNEYMNVKRKKIKYLGVGCIQDKGVVQEVKHNINYKQMQKIK